MQDARLRFVVRLAVSAALLAALVAIVDPGAVADVLGRTSLGLFALSVLLHSADRVLMAFKWWSLLRVQRLEIGFSKALRAYYLSSFAGLFLPMTVGADAVRLIALRGTAATPTLVSSIVVERGIGAISQALLCTVSLALIFGLQLDIGLTNTTLVLLIGGMVCVLIGCLPLSFRVASRLGEALGNGHGYRRKIGDFAHEYARWRYEAPALWTFLLLTLLEGLLPVAIYAVVSRALGLVVPFHLFLATVPIVFLIARLPVSLGGIGIQEGTFVYLAGVLGIGSTQAASIALLVLAGLLLALAPGALAYLLTPERQPIVVSADATDDDGPLGRGPL